MILLLLNVLIYNNRQSTYLKFIKMKKIILLLTLSLTFSYANAQLLQNIAKKAIAKAVNNGVNSLLKNTTLTLDGANYTFSSTTESLYGSSIWQVIMGNEEYIKVYKDAKIQLEAGQIYRGKDFSIDILIINDTSLVIQHLINRKPYEEDYLDGPLYDIILIRDSVIFMKTINNVDSLMTEIDDNKKLEGFTKIVKFENDSIYSFESATKEDKFSTLGSYKNFMASKANFIFASIYYKLTYEEIYNQLISEDLANALVALKNDESNNASTNGQESQNVEQQDFEYFLEDGEIKFKEKVKYGTVTHTFQRKQRFKGEDINIAGFYVGTFKGEKYIIFWYETLYSGVSVPKIAKIQKSGNWSTQSDFECECQWSKVNISNITYVDEQTIMITCNDGKKANKTIYASMF